MGCISLDLWVDPLNALPNSRPKLMKFNSEACFSQLERCSRVRKVRYWVYPGTCEYQFPGRADIYLKEMAKLFPYFPKVTLGKLMRNGFTFETEHLPGPYVNGLLRVVRPLQEQTDLIDAFVSWRKILREVLRGEEKLKGIDDWMDETNVSRVALCLSQHAFPTNLGMYNFKDYNTRPTKAPYVHTIWDNGLKKGMYWSLKTLETRIALREIPPYYVTGRYWHDYLGPERFLAGKGPLVRTSGLMEQVQFQPRKLVVSLIKELTGDIHDEKAHKDVP